MCCTPASRTRKPDCYRDVHRWNIVWACVRRVLGLPYCSNATKLVGLHSVSVSLGVPHTSLMCYFWGISGAKGGKAISQKQVDMFESKLPEFLQKCQQHLQGETARNQQLEKHVHEGSKANCIHIIKTGNAGTIILQSLGDRAAFKKEAQHPAAWSLASQRGASCVNLFPGFRTRHVFSSRSKLAGRCFELAVLKDTRSSHSVGSSSLSRPIFVVREVKYDGGHGFAIPNSIKEWAYTPNAVWDSIFKRCGLSGCNYGFELSGFHDCSVQQMLSAEEASLHQFGKRKSLQQMSSRHIERLVAAAGDGLRQAHGGCSGSWQTRGGWSHKHCY